MTNCEHLIENALMSIQHARQLGLDAYDAFQDTMNCKHNKAMLDSTNMTCDELWEIAQYIVYTHDECMKIDIQAEMENQYGYKLKDIS